MKELGVRCTGGNVTGGMIVNGSPAPVSELEIIGTELTKAKVDGSGCAGRRWSSRRRRLSLSLSLSTLWFSFFFSLSPFPHSLVSEKVVWEIDFVLGLITFSPFKITIL